VRPFLFCLIMASGAVAELHARPAHHVPRVPANLVRAIRKGEANDPERAATRYVIALADLNGDGRAEALIYVTGGGACGSGGCNLYIMERHRTSWRTVSTISVAWPDVRLLATSHHGWRDIGVFVHGGGIVHGYEAQLRFDGIAYPANPTIWPARPERHESQGRVVIAARDRGRRLFF
jgi:hypothetical protein